MGAYIGKGGVVGPASGWVGGDRDVADTWKGCGTSEKVAGVINGAKRTERTYSRDVTTVLKETAGG